MRCRGLIIGVALAPWFLNAQQKPSPQMAVHKYPSDHLSISIPTDWIAIPKSELDQMSANVREVAPKAKPQPYNYGFQASAESPYPRVLIQIKTSGRWAEKVFADMPKLPSMKDEVEKGVQSVSPAFAALNIKMGALTYDPVKQVAWLRMQFTGDDGQTVQGFSGLHPTNVGSIQVHCYAPTADFDEYAPLFSEIITSVQVDDGWRYRARSGASGVLGGFGDLGSSAVTGAIGGLAAVLVLRVLRKRKRAAKTAHRVA